MLDRCPFTKKITYLSSAAAKRASFDGMAPFLCPHYPHWHVGHPWKSSRARLKTVKEEERAHAS